MSVYQRVAHTKYGDYTGILGTSECLELICHQHWHHRYGLCSPCLGILQYIGAMKSSKKRCPPSCVCCFQQPATWTSLDLRSHPLTSTNYSNYRYIMIYSCTIRTWKVAAEHPLFYSRAGKTIRPSKYMEIYVDICRYMSIYVDICRYM